MRAPSADRGSGGDYWAGYGIAGADVQHDIKWRNGGGAAGAAPGFQKSEPEYQGSVTEFLEFLKGLRL